MRAVSRFEHNLLRILYCILGRAPRAEALALVSRVMDRPGCLGRDAVELIESALAKGCVRLLANGGWRRERYLREGRPVEGRLWQRTRTEELSLAFSSNAMDLLIWLTAQDAVAAKQTWVPRFAAPLTVGDQFLVFLAYRTVRVPEVGCSLGRSLAVTGSALCRLAFPDDFANTPYSPIAWDTWIAGPGATVFEALQYELADQWVRVERSKAGCVSGERMLALGAAQQQVLNGLLDALEAHQRRDLGRFLLMAAARLLRDRPPAAAWTARLNATGLTMSQRTEAYAAALAFLRVLDRLRSWQQQARTIGYFDEGYAASQLWKDDWDRWGGEFCCEAADAVVRQGDPMRTAAKDAERASRLPSGVK